MAGKPHCSALPAQTDLRDPSYAGAVLRQAPLLLTGIFCLWLLSERMQFINTAEIPDTLRLVAPSQWIFAGLATALSFWAIGRYDVVLHKVLKTNIPDHRAARSGMAAIAVSQTLGLGLLTGAFVRWRLLRPMSFARAMALTGFVGLAFLVCSAVVLAISSLMGPSPLPAWSVMAIILLAGLGTFLLVIRPNIHVRHRSIRLPSLIQICTLVGLTAADTFAAGLAFTILLPPGAGLGITLVLPAFLLALIAGLLSGTPGGIGAFEITLLAALPQVPETDLLTTILAFRIVYFALPAGIALCWLAFDHQKNPAASPRRKRRSCALPISQADRSETALIRQNGGTLSTWNGTTWPSVQTGQTQVALFDPMKGDPGSALTEMRRHALRLGASTLIYKCQAQTAVAARRAGWHTLHIADELRLDPQSFSLSGPKHRQLRRKLRHAERAGVVTCQLQSPPPEFDEIARDWQQVHGRERGLSMGRYARDAISDQQIFAATQSGAICAFVTFHESQAEMCLDLMRHRCGLPDGTMHALILYALRFAKKRGHKRLSLAAVPTFSPFQNQWLNCLWNTCLAQSGAPGLHRFKFTFAPRATPLYAAAPSRIALGFGLAEITRAIHAPDHIDFAHSCARTHKHVENYEFASTPRLWHLAKES